MSHQTVAPYNFFNGHPSTELLPTQEILDATTHVLHRFHKTMDTYDGKNDTHPLNYGTDPGNLEVRQTIVDWNDKNYKLATKTDPDCLNLDSGASYGIANALLQFTSPHNGVTRQAFVVSPTYFLINSVLIDAGFAGKLTAVRTDSNGQVDLDAFAKVLDEFDAKEPAPLEEITKDDIPEIYDPYRPIKHVYRYILYVVPTFGNPQGGTFTPENRLGLIELARKHDMLIIADDVYDLLDYRPGNPTPHKRLVNIDRETLPEGEKWGNVLSNATFSKILGPGIRAGYQESATPELAFLLSQGGAQRSGGSPAQLNSVIIGDMIRSGAVDKIVANLKSVFSARAKSINESINRYLPRGTTMLPIEGGYFCWVNLPEGYDLKKIAAECLTRGVVLATGDSFEVTGDELGWGKRGVRLSISHLTSEEIDKGIKIWGEVCPLYRL